MSKYQITLHTLYIYAYAMINIIYLMVNASNWQRLVSTVWLVLYILKFNEHMWFELVAGV